MDNFSSTRIAVPKQELRLLGLISVPIQQYCLKTKSTTLRTFTGFSGSQCWSTNI